MRHQLCIIATALTSIVTGCGGSGANDSIDAALTIDGPGSDHNVDAALAIADAHVDSGSGNDASLPSDARPDASAPDARTSFALTAMAGQSVSGDPSSGITIENIGASVNYNYAPVSNFSAAIVEVDGALSAASGSISMTADHWLWAFGQPLTGTDFADSITVPNDPTLIPFPQFYNSQPSFTARVADPYCAVQTDVISYPHSFLGAFPMPEISGAPIPAQATRGVFLKDNWEYQFNNPSTNTGCSGDWHTAAANSMQRIVALGADHISMYQNAVLLDSNAGLLDFDCWNGAGCSDASQIPDSEIAWAANEANALGVELHLYMQVEGVDETRAPYPTPLTSDWLQSWFDGYARYMVHEATIAEANGIAVLEADWGVWWIDWTQSPYQAIYQARMADVMSQMHAVYSGKLVLGSVAPWASDDAALMSNVDEFLVDLFGISFNEADNQNINVSQMKAKYANVIQNYANIFAKYNKPVMFRVQAESYRDYLLNGWVEDAFCTNGCQENSLTTDFSVQAISIEAQLEAIKTQTAFAVASVDVNSYWFVDVVLPQFSFPNLSFSIRDKPAESVVYQWFKQ